MIIAICGPKRSGKDTVASYLVNRHNYKHVKISQPLKDACGSLFGWTAYQMEEDVKENIDPNWGISPRDGLKFVGTEIMQYKIQELLPNIGRKFWINTLINTLKSKPREAPIVISDMRFIHEWEVLKNEYHHNLVTIKINKSSTLPIDLHSSETEWRQIKEDILIENDGTIHDLCHMVENKLIK